MGRAIIIEDDGVKLRFEPVYGDETGWKWDWMVWCEETDDWLRIPRTDFTAMDVLQSCIMTVQGIEEWPGADTLPAGRLLRPIVNALQREGYVRQGPDTWTLPAAQGAMSTFAAVQDLARRTGRI